MLGAIIGDIVGSRFEFGPAPEENFKLFTDKCGFTDDTVCTIAVADAVLNERPYDEALLDWCARYPHPMWLWQPLLEVGVQWRSPSDGLLWQRVGHACECRGMAL